MSSVSLRLPTEVAERLSFLSEHTGRSKTYYMIEAIKTHIEDLEDIYIAEKRLADIRAGKSQIISSEEMEHRLGLEN